MKIKLLDYKNREHWVDIPDDTEEIDIQVISGDMILTSPIYYDTCSTRLMDFYDGTYTIKKEKFDKLNSITSNYDIINI